MCDCSITYTLPEIAPEEHYRQPGELQAGETTARMTIYELLGAMLATPAEETHARALSGDWAASLGREAARLNFPVLFGHPALDRLTSVEELCEDYVRLFGGGHGAGAIAPLTASAWFDDSTGARHREEAAHFYDYYGLSISPEDPRPADHLATGLEFMRHLTFSEAAACSPRLQLTFRAAQRDFLARSLTPWLPPLRDCVAANDAVGFWTWVVDNVAAFTAADLACLQAPAMCSSAPSVAGLRA